MIVNHHRKCPKCNEVIEKTAPRCKYCGENFRSNVMSVVEKLQTIAMAAVALGVFVGLMWLLIGLEAGAFDDPPPAAPVVPEGGVRYEGQVYSAWKSARHSGIESALVSYDVYCPDFKYRKSLSSSSEYIVYCMFEHGGNSAPASAYIVYPQIKSVLGPYTPSPVFE